MQRAVGEKFHAPEVEPLWYNNWRQVAVPPLDEFTPELPVSVIVPYYKQPRELARTLAALEGQTYPRELFEVVVVDDGSPEPLAQLRNTPLDVKVVRQEDQGFGLARARNTGVRAAANDVLAFLDADLLPEADWLAAHVRWHQVVPDAVTQGAWAHVAVDGVDAGTIRNRPGTLKELFEGRDLDFTDIRWFEFQLSRTDDLTSRDDDLFRVVAGGNLGIHREFYELVGAYDESFTQWGGEDTEFGYRAFTRGGLLVPARDAFVWHQGLREEGLTEKERSQELQRAKLAHLMANPVYRTGLQGRTFTVPQYVVTIEGGDLPAKRLLPAVERVLSGPVHDLVVRLELSEVQTGHPSRAEHKGYRVREWLEHHLGPDPRVRVAPLRPALEAFPASPFHVTLPAGRPLHTDVVGRLRDALGTAAIGRAEFPDGSHVSIVRAWALHRAARTPWQASDFGEVVTIPARTLQPWADESAESACLTPAEYPLGVEIVALGARSQAVFAASACVARMTDGQHADGVVTDTVNGRHADAAAAEPAASRHFDLVVADTAGEVAGADQATGKTDAKTAAPTAAPADEGAGDTGPEAATPTGMAAARTVILAEAPPMLSIPAFDPRTDNPIGWRRDVGRDAVGALGPLGRLPRDCGANRVVSRDDRAALRQLHHLEDVAAFHADTVTRAGELARLAATGVVVHLADESLADGDRGLAPYLGAELFGLMTRDVRNLDLDGREALSVRMRREALRTHSLASRARQVAVQAALPDPPRPPLVSILLATRRPEMLERALAAVRRQTWPRLELILGLHGEGFGEVAPDAAGPSVPVTALRLDAALPLGSVLNALTDAAGGTLLAKMDDDDLYGPDHILDLALAHEYSQAPLVGKAAEFFYLAASDQTIRRFSAGRFNAGGEQFNEVVAGAALLIERHMLDRVGGWKRSRLGEDGFLIHAVQRTGARVYRMHPRGWAAVRHDQGSAWTIDDAILLAQAENHKPGWQPEWVGISDGAGAISPVRARFPTPGARASKASGESRPCVR